MDYPNFIVSNQKKFNNPVVYKIIQAILPLFSLSNFNA